MDRLRTPLMVQAIYVLLVGLVLLSPSLTRSVFGYEVKDPGVLLVSSLAFLGFGVVLWAIAGTAEARGRLAIPVAIALIIGAVLLIWGWTRGLFTARNVLVPVIINIALIVWIWTARPKS